MISNRCSSTSRHIVIIFLSAISFCSIVLLLAPSSFLEKPCGDCDSVAANFLAGKGWIDDSGNFADARPPGHSLIIIGLKKTSEFTGLTEISIYWLFNVLMLASSSVLLFLIARLVWEAGPIWVVPVVWTTCPFSLWFLNQPYSEIPFFVFFFSSVLLFLLSYQLVGRRKYFVAFVLGITLAAAMMVRSIAIGLPVIYFLVWIVTTPGECWRSHATYLAFLTIGVFLVVAPWSYIAYGQTGNLHFLTPPTLAINSVGNGISFVTDIDGDRKELNLSPGVEKLASDILNGFNQIGKNERQKTNLAAYYRIIFEKASTSPGAAVEFLMIKIARAWYGTYTHSFEKITRSLQVCYLGVIIYSMWRIIGYRLLPRRILLLFMAIVFYFWAIAVMFEPLVRYMVPPLGILFVCLPALVIKNQYKNNPP